MRKSTLPFPALLLLLAAQAAAQTAAPSTQAPFKPFLELGFEERVRMEEWNNAMDWNDRTSPAQDQILQYRFRSRVWAQFNPTENLEFAAGVAQENRKFDHPDAAASQKYRQVFVETLYVDYKFAPDWAVRLGRQNIQKGEGFILMDGSPGDGSRSLYYNAMDLTWRVGSKSSLEFIAIANQGRDTYLPRVNDPENPMSPDQARLAEYDEQAVGLYFTGKEWKAVSLESYYFYKTELNDPRAVSQNPSKFQADRRLHTLGSRVVTEPGYGLTFSGEFALQRGTEEAHPMTANDTSHDIAAWGGYARAKKGFDVAGKPSISLGYIALSGNDPKSSTRGGWDPLFGRWPKYSELFLYAFVPEKGAGYWSNVSMWELEAKVSPLPILDLRATYYTMDALKAQTPGGIYGAGKHRGDLYEFRADVKIIDGLKAHAVVERFAPGTFYAGQDAGYFLRFEVSYLFKKRF